MVLAPSAKRTMQEVGILIFSRVASGRRPFISHSASQSAASDLPPPAEGRLRPEAEDGPHNCDALRLRDLLCMPLVRISNAEQLQFVMSEI